MTVPKLTHTANKVFTYIVLLFSDIVQSNLPYNSTDVTDLKPIGLCNDSQAKYLASNRPMTAILFSEIWSAKVVKGKDPTEVMASIRLENSGQY
jgi:hypothetical protein